MARRVKANKAGQGGCCEQSQCVCLNLRRAARAVTQLYDDAFRGAGIRATQLTILGPMAVVGPMTITQLAEVTVTDRTTLTRNLRLLVKKELVQIDQGDDRREHEVSVTGRGRAMLQKAYPQWERIQGKIAKKIGERRLERLLRDLSAVVDAARDA